MLSPSRSVRAACGAAVVVAFAASACGPVQAGQAAIIGSRTISVDHLQRITTRVLRIPAARQQFGSDTATLQRSVLSRLIDSVLLHTAAHRAGVTVTQSAIDARIKELVSQAGGLSALQQQAVTSGISPSELRVAVGDIVLEDALSQALVKNITVTPAQLRQAYQQNIDTLDQVHAAHILVRTKAEATRLLAEVKRTPASFARLARADSIDTTSGQNGGDLGTNGIHSFVSSFAQPVFAAKPGSFIVVHSRFGWHVVHVISHHRTTLAQAAPQLRASLLSSVSNSKLVALITATARALRIHVSPRYGHWVLSKRSVDPPLDTLSHPLPTPTPTPTSVFGPGTGTGTTNPSG
jgi:parvulin-like peptidyl-prolyl isomerase